ncbi:MAG: hypothetical protein HY686_05705 [Chloroflexi bacterium]|nr:hypothetical protein [Chloroflexota bacterium]
MPDGSYWWRVKAVDGAGNESPWAGSGIIIDTHPSAAPQILAPRRGEIVPDGTPTFDWSTVLDPSGVTYSLEAHEDKEFTLAVLVKERLSSSHYALSREDALPPKTYYWRVRAVDGAGNKRPWMTSSFTLSASPIGPYITHTAEGRGDCLACHNLAGLWPVPDTHQDRINETCQICHQPVPGGPPGIEHPLEGRIQCDTCHAVRALAPLPESHQMRTPKTCLMCHETIATGVP